MLQQKKEKPTLYVFLAILGAVLMFEVLPGVLLWAAVRDRNQAYDEAANRDAYEIIKEGLVNMDETIEVPGRNMEEVSEIFKRILDRDEDVFWVAWTYEYGERDLFGRVTGYLQPNYVFTKEEVEAMQTDLAEIVSKVREECEGMSPFEKALFAYDLICEITEYDYEALELEEKEQEEGAVDSPEVVMASSAYGALINGKAICGGYSKAYRKLLSSLDVPCECVCGTTDDELHEWNRVMLGDEWYFVDVTWGDTDELISYSYFAIDSDTLLLDHDFDEDEPVKETHATAYNYDVYYGYYAPEGTKKEEIAAIIGEQIESGSARVRFESEADFEAMWQCFFEEAQCYDLIPVLESIKEDGYTAYWVKYDDRPVIEIYLAEE